MGCGTLGATGAPQTASEPSSQSDVAAREASPGDVGATDGSADEASQRPGEAQAKVDGDALGASSGEEGGDEEGDVEEDEADDHEAEKGSADHGDEEGAYAEYDAAGLDLKKAAPPKAPTPGASKARPLDDISRKDLAKLLKKEPASLGPLSVGLPNSGRLFNAVELPESKYFHRVSPDYAFGTEETVNYLTTAVARVHEQYPDSDPLFVGHLSRKSGGHLAPHLSHQSGRDVDLGFYYSDKPRWYARATTENLDVARTWALVRAIIIETDVEMVLVDHSVIGMLKSYALSHGEDPVWVERIFSGKEGGRMIIRHARGHRTHLHIRFFNPEAQRRGQKLYPLLVEQNLVPPVTVYSTFRAKKGDTLGKIAKRYNTTVEALKRANGLRKSLIVAGRVYKIAQKGGPKPVEQQLTFPARQLPEAPVAQKGAKPPAARSGKAPTTASPKPTAAAQGTKAKSARP